MAQTDVDQRKMLWSKLPFAWAEMVNPRLERVNINDIPFRIPNGKKLELWASSCLSDVSKSKSAIISFVQIIYMFSLKWLGYLLSTFHKWIYIIDLTHFDLTIFFAMDESWANSVVPEGEKLCGGPVVIGRDNLPSPGWNRVNWPAKHWKGQWFRHHCELIVPR